MSTGETRQAVDVRQTAAVVTTRQRRHDLDAFRGLAILAMIVDHVVLVVGGPEVLRYTIGHLAMPAFFVLAGHLVGSPRVRHIYIGALGVGLAWLIPWLDSPNVLTLWAVGVFLLAGLRAAHVPLLIVPVVALTAMAHGYVLGGTGTGFYDPLALWSLMAVGTMVPAGAFAWAGRAPRWVAQMGRHPIAWYSGHLLAICALSLLWVAGS